MLIYLFEKFTDFLQVNFCGYDDGAGYGAEASIYDLDLTIVGKIGRVI